MESLEISLQNLQTSYINLYLMHSPSSTDPENPEKHYPDWDFVDAWYEIQTLLDTGKVRNIGASNFGIKNMAKLLSAKSIKITSTVD